MSRAGLDISYFFREGRISMFCENCGSPMPEDSKFCMNCGAKAAVPEGQTAQPSAQETAAAAETIQVDEAPAVDAAVLTEQQEAPANPVQYEPQPQPAVPEIQPKPVQPAPQPQAYQQPAPQPQSYQQPAPQPQVYQQSAPQSGPASYAQPQPAPQSPAYQQPAAPASQLAIPKNERPLSVWKYIGIFLVTGLPVIGFIMILVWSFGSSWNKNTRNLARAILIFGIIGFVLAVASVIINIEAIRALIDYFNANFEIGLTG